jgi:hypothetical protein
MLLDPLEEQFHLPAVLVERADGRGRQHHLIGEEDERLAGLGILVSNPARMRGVAYCKQLMTEIDAKIAQLDVQALTASAAAKIKYKKEIDSLKVTRAKTVAQLEKMESATGRAWSNAKRGFADAYRDLQRAYSKTIRQFR